MATKIVEFHGHTPLSRKSRAFASNHLCPFTPQSASDEKKKDVEENLFAKCKKKNGVCTLQAKTSEELVIVCPHRLYARNFQVLREVANKVFGRDTVLLDEDEAKKHARENTLPEKPVIAFGAFHSGELGITAPSEEDAKNSFKIDYILVKVSEIHAPRIVCGN